VRTPRGEDILLDGLFRIHDVRKKLIVRAPARSKLMNNNKQIDELSENVILI
jgi:hypothetical protein